MLPLSIPSSRSAVTHHVDSIKNAGRRKQARITEALFHILDGNPNFDPEKFSILTTGSDGRFENKPFAGVDSNIELFFAGYQDCTSLIDFIRERTSYVVDNIDTKILGKDSLILYRENKDLVFPTRIWDAVAYSKDKQILQSMQEGLSQEIIGAKSNFCKSFLTRLQRHKKIMLQGKEEFKGNTCQLFDPDTGFIHYNPNEHTHGVKSGALRYIQYTLAVSLMRYIRDKGVHPEFIKELPTNIPERLDYIFDNKFTRYDSKKIEYIKYVYGLFLSIYHELQYRYFTQGETSYQIQDRDLLKDIKEILGFLEKEFKPEKFFPS